MKDYHSRQQLSSADEYCLGAKDLTENNSQFNSITYNRPVLEPCSSTEKVEKLKRLKMKSIHEAKLDRD